MIADAKEDTEMEIGIVSQCCEWLGMIFPLECMQMRFMQTAMLGLLLLAPMAAVAGTQVVNFRMAFFSDAIGHSAFAGVAFGLLFAVSPDLTMPLLALLVGLGITAVRQRSGLSTDTIIGVFFSAVVAAGLAVVSRYPSAVRNMQMFLYGDILTVSDTEIAALAVLFLIFLLFQFFAFNKLICIGLNLQLAKAHRVRIVLHQYLFAALLALIVIFSVKTVGVLLVTAMLITPTAAARNCSSSYGRMVWLSIALGMISAVAGLLLSAQEWMRTAAGATIVLCSCFFFCISLIFRRHFRS